MFAMGASPYESIGSTLPYELHLFGRFCATQKVTKTDRVTFLLLDAVSLKTSGGY